MLSSADEAQTAVESAFRHQHGRLVAALTRRLGVAHLDLIESAVQEALTRALACWSQNGVPDRADAWLIKVAYNVACDEVRRGSRETSAQAPEREGELAPELDDELSLIFLCCHPTLARSAQVALTLKVASGFTVAEIASAFLSEPATIAQRIVRAKQTLRSGRVTFEIPNRDELEARVDSILDVLYLVFNEGYSPSVGDVAVKTELCSEALRLTRMLSEALGQTRPACEALRALLCFQSSRTNARIADDESLLLLSEQDRDRWDRALIAEGFDRLGRAGHGEVSRLHVEAAIAASHAAAPTYAETDWTRILWLYDRLRTEWPSPVVEVNRAIATAMVLGAERGLDELDAIPERDLISQYPFALAAYAELHGSLGQVDLARDYLRRALALQQGQAQRKLLERKLASLPGCRG